MLHGPLQSKLARMSHCVEVGESVGRAPPWNAWLWANLATSDGLRSQLVGDHRRGLTPSPPERWPHLSASRRTDRRGCRICCEAQDGCRARIAAARARSELCVMSLALRIDSR